MRFVHAERHEIRRIAVAGATLQHALCLRSCGGFELEPRAFSFNSPYSACQVCKTSDWSPDIDSASKTDA